MVVDGFGFGIGLVWIIALSLLVNSFVLCGATTIVLCQATAVILCGATIVVLCGATTLDLCGATTLALCGTAPLVCCRTHHPLWLPFHLIGWFGL
jgi:hypothetical protein